MLRSVDRCITFIRKKQEFFLALIIWIFGIFFGCVTALSLGSTYHTLLETSSAQPATLSGLAIGVVLPWGLFLFFGKMRLMWLQRLTVFIKVTSVTACSVGLSGAFGSAGWLVRLFVQFSDILTLPLFCWLSLRSSAKSISRHIMAVAAAWYTAVCLVDYLVISPFFSGVIVK